MNNDNELYEVSAIIVAKQTIDAMLAQPIYKEDLGEFSKAYCTAMSIYDEDITLFLDIVKYGLEIMSISQSSFYSVVPDRAVLRQGIMNFGYEFGSILHRGKVIYWKYADKVLKIYQRKPIFWDKYDSMIKGVSNQNG
jgi:hypothetical protein